MLTFLLLLLQQSPGHESTDEQVGGMQDVLASPILLGLLLLLILTVIAMAMRRRRG